ncbi:MAG: tricarboxylate transporter [Peptococcaceae bacterium]|nr:tricarboxylate transporter [Candidatus Syntrophopropionicum ammoniitolerans]
MTTENGLKFKVTDAFFLVMLILALYVGLAKPWVPDLPPEGHLVLLALIVTIGMWIFAPLNIPRSVAGFFFLLFTLAIKVPAPNVFSGFTSGALWTLIPALFFGFVLIKTGLGKRIGFLVMKMFNPSYPMLIVAFVIIGLALSALTPSITVRCVIIVPIAVSVIEACQLELKSKGSALLLLTAWAMAVIPGTGWLTGSLHGPIILGMMEAIPDLKGMLTFSSYLQVMLIPALVLTLILIVGGYFALKPSEPITLKKEYFQEAYTKLGAWNKDQIVSAIVLTVCFLMFFTNKMHGIPDGATVLAGLFLLTAFGVVKGPEISTGISWDLIMFIGVAMSIGGVFGVTGVNKWLVGVLVPLIAPLTSSPWMLCYSIIILFFILRFFDVAVFIPTMTILIPILPEIANNFGINPLVWVPLFIMAANCFFLTYTNMFALVAESIAEKRSWTSGQSATYGMVYGVAVLITLAISIPYWTSIGMFQ